MNILFLYDDIAILRNHLCELNIVCASAAAESRAKIWCQIGAFRPPVALAAVRSMAVVLLLLICC